MLIWFIAACQAAIGTMFAVFMVEQIRLNSTLDTVITLAVSVVCYLSAVLLVMP